MMPTETREDRQTQRIEDLYATDPQFAAARPSRDVSAAADEPGLRLPHVVQAVMQGYADRPALGQRAVEFITDPNTGRTAQALLPRFDTITYRQLWDRVQAVSAALRDEPVRVGDRAPSWDSPAWTTP